MPENNNPFVYTPHHRVIVCVSPGEFAQRITKEAIWKRLQGMPEEAILIRCSYDNIENELIFIFEHPSFPIMLEGQRPPEFKPLFETSNDG